VLLYEDLKVGKVIDSSHQASNFLSAVTEPNLKPPRTIFSLPPPFFCVFALLIFGRFTSEILERGISPELLGLMIHDKKIK
jgi:hypothetical protein